MITEKGALAVSSSVRKLSAIEKDLRVGWQENSTQEKKRKCTIQILYTPESFVVLIMCPTYSFMNCCGMEQVGEFVTYLSCNGPIILHFKTIHCHEGQYIHVIKQYTRFELVCFWKPNNTNVVSIFVHFLEFIHKHPRFSTVTLPCPCKGGQGSEEFKFT